MSTCPRSLSIGLLAFVAHWVAAPQVGAVPFSRTTIIIEVNATAGDGGIQISLDAEGWNELEVLDPNGSEVFEVSGSGSVGRTGITELFFESAEPSFEDLPLDQLLQRFVAGSYRFAGTTVDGKRLSGRATLKHNIPDGPTVTSPSEGDAVNPGEPVVIDWDDVTAPFPGTHLPVTVVAYQVIVERVTPTPLLAFSVHLPATVTKVTVPAEFLQASAEYKFEVLAIEASGNQTITESSFTTTAGSVTREDSGNAEDGDVRHRAALRQNHPNPFNPATTLEFELPSAGLTTVRVVDVQGRLVRTLVNGQLPAGSHRATWDGTDSRGRPVASGVYFGMLTGQGLSESRRMILTR